MQNLTFEPISGVRFGQTFSAVREFAIARSFAHGPPANALADTLSVNLKKSGAPRNKTRFTPTNIKMSALIQTEFRAERLP